MSVYDPTSFTSFSSSVFLAAVTGAKWTAQYDVRVDIQTKESPVTLVYKAAVTQHTAEVSYWINKSLYRLTN